MSVETGELQRAYDSSAGILDIYEVFDTVNLSYPITYVIMNELFKSTSEAVSSSNPEGQEGWKTEPAESFLIDIMNVKSYEMMRKIGCVFDAAKVIDENTVRITGHDGGGPGDEHTLIEVVVRKGPSYKSPKELASH